MCFPNGARLRIAAACLALLQPSQNAAASGANYLLLRIVIGDYLLADAVEGEERGGAVYVNTAELAEALEEPPLGAQLVSVSELPKFFPAEFSADLRRQELKVSGRGALGVEKRLLAEYESRIWRPSALALPQIEPPRRLLAPPFLALRHSLERGADGVYRNSDSLHLYGDFAFGEGSLVLSESEGVFSGAHGIWRRDSWRLQGAADEDGGLSSASLGNNFSLASWHWNAELHRRARGKWGGLLGAAKRFEEENLSVRAGAGAGERNSWRLGASGVVVGGGGWSADYLHYPGAAAGGMRGRSSFRVYYRSFAVSHIAENIRGRENRSETGLRHFFNAAGFGAEWRLRREQLAESENTAEFGLRKSWPGLARTSARFSHRRSFGRGAESRFSGLSLQREKEGQTGLLELAHLHGKGENSVLAEWRSPFFGGKIFMHAGASADFGGEIRRAFINISYAAARNPRDGVWRADAGFLGAGAVSVCGRDKDGKIFRGAELSLKNGPVLEGGCAFFPSSGGEVALDGGKLPPWISAGESAFYAAVRPGVATEVDFDMRLSGEVEGVVRRGGVLVPGAEVRLFARTNPPHANPDILPGGGAVRSARSGFDGYYFFGEVPAGRYYVESGGKFRRRVRITVGEAGLLTADIDLPPRRK